MFLDCCFLFVLATKEDSNEQLGPKCVNIPKPSESESGTLGLNAKDLVLLLGTGRGKP